MNKIRVIDLLNKIANGEEVPKILHNGKYGIYEKEKRAVAFYNDEKCTSYYGSWFRWDLCEDGLNDEIKIIEEQKIENNLKKMLIPSIQFNLGYIDTNDKEVVIKEMNKTIQDLYDRTLALNTQINKIIDYINSKEDSNE